jgi:iron complex outermembrane recepter protein
MPEGVKSFSAQPIRERPHHTNSLLETMNFPPARSPLDPLNGSGCRAFASNAWRCLGVLACAVAAFVVSAVGQTQAPIVAGADAAADWPDLAALGRIEVISVSKRMEPAWRSNSAVTVLTGEDIHRLGADSIPEALRGVAGLNVAQINGSTWGVGARGFGNQFSTKLLVMVDGRSVYTPVFGGVFWDAQDYLLDDIDRIEVVLGSGGSLWGANAVNGVINILTKSARDTQGDLFYGGAGDVRRAMIGARHGWQAGQDAFARIYVKYRATGDSILPTGDQAGDATRSIQGGFRLDGASGGQSSWTVQGDLYRRWNDFRVTLPTLAAPPLYQMTDTTGEDVDGANLLGRWETRFASGSILKWQAFLDHTQRSGPIFDVRVRTADIEMQHSIVPGDRHEIDWGLSARRVDIRTRDRWIPMSPNDSNSTLESGFLQDRISLVPSVLAFTAGVKVEHSSVSGVEMQPCAKFSWFPSFRHTVWVGWARAVRTPAYTELATRVDVAVLPPGQRHPILPTVVRGIGNPDLEAERLGTFDAGWRWQPTDRFNLSLSAYHNNYSRLIKVTSGTPFVQTAPVPALVIPLPEDNGMAGHTYGGELSALWQVRANWRLAFGYAHNRVNVWADTPDPFDYSGIARGSPRNTASITSTLEPAPHWELVTVARYVGSVGYYQIPSYFECALQLAWRPDDDWEIALVGQNLLHDRHTELSPALAGPVTEVPRDIYLKVTWKH